MADVTYLIFGVPFGARDRAALLQTMVGKRASEAAMDFLMASIEHNTEKSGALLGAQGLFVAIDIFAIGRNWPATTILPSLFLLLVGALTLMTNLRGALDVYRPGPTRTSADQVGALFKVVLSRTLRFNIGLNLTFLSILLLTFSVLIHRP